MLFKTVMLFTVQQPRDYVTQGKLYRHNPYVGLLRSKEQHWCCLK